MRATFRVAERVRSRNQEFSPPKADMKSTAISVALICALCWAPLAAQVTFPGAAWERVPPERSGWSKAGLAELQAWSNQHHSTTLMIVHHGVVVAEWGDTSTRLELESVRKSLLSALIGIAVSGKKISLDSTLEQLDVDDNPPALTKAEKQATVRMLLQARSGVYHKALYESADMAKNRPARGSHMPGTFWYYNNWDFNALGTIFEHAAGVGVYDGLGEWIARPLGMQDYRPGDGHYVTGPDSIHPAYAIRMSARDLARFALLYARKGNWAGRQVVPVDWVQESTQPYSVSRPGLGYGYMWWTAGPDPKPGELAKGCFFAAGTGGQLAFVFPAIDLVLVHQIDEGLGLPEPSSEDIGQLVKLTLKAGGFLPSP